MYYILTNCTITRMVDTPVENEVKKIIKAKQKFERMVITKEEGLELFAMSVLSRKKLFWIQILKF